MWYWPGMAVQVRSWVAECEGCQKRKPAHFQSQSLLQTLVPEGPWKRVAMDFMGPLPEMQQGNRHMLVVAVFTKWVEAFPVPNMEAEMVAKVVTWEIICRFGMLRGLHSDQAHTSESGVMKELARMLGMDKKQTTHP